MLACLLDSRKRGAGAMWIRREGREKTPAKQDRSSSGVMEWEQKGLNAL